MGCRLAWGGKARLSGCARRRTQRPWQGENRPYHNTFGRQIVGRREIWINRCSKAYYIPRVYFYFLFTASFRNSCNFPLTSSLRPQATIRYQFAIGPSRVIISRDTSCARQPGQPSLHPSRQQLWCSSLEKIRVVLVKLRFKLLHNPRTPPNAPWQLATIYLNNLC
jgi:hypothetical protein